MTEIQKGQTWIYTKTETEYIVEHTGQSKIEEGPWVLSVTYCDKASGLKYTRDYETFIRKFTLKANQPQGVA